MPFSYRSPARLRPVELWRLRLGTGEVVSAMLSPTADSVSVVWYLDDQLQDAAEFQERESAISWAEDVRRMLTATRNA